MMQIHSLNTSYTSSKLHYKRSYEILLNLDTLKVQTFKPILHAGKPRCKPGYITFKMVILEILTSSEMFCSTDLASFKRLRENSPPTTERTSPKLLQHVFPYNHSPPLKNVQN